MTIRQVVDRTVIPVSASTPLAEYVNRQLRIRQDRQDSLEEGEVGEVDVAIMIGVEELV
jgi:hypothetical protein